jgi:hypothetical protein
MTTATITRLHETTKLELELTRSERIALRAAVSMYLQDRSRQLGLARLEGNEHAKEFFERHYTAAYDLAEKLERL